MQSVARERVGLLLATNGLSLSTLVGLLMHGLLAECLD